MRVCVCVCVCVDISFTLISSLFLFGFYYVLLLFSFCQFSVIPALDSLSLVETPYILLYFALCSFKPRRWEDNIKMDLQEVGGGVDWMELAQDRDRWQAIVSTVMNLRVP